MCSWVQSAASCGGEALDSWRSLESATPRTAEGQPPWPIGRAFWTSLVEGAPTATIHTPRGSGRDQSARRPRRAHRRRFRPFRGKSERLGRSAGEPPRRRIRRHPLHRRLRRIFLPGSPGQPRPRPTGDAGARRTAAHLTAGGPGPGTHCRAIRRLRPRLRLHRGELQRLGRPTAGPDERAHLDHPRVHDHGSARSGVTHPYRGGLAGRGHQRDPGIDPPARPRTTPRRTRTRCAIDGRLDRSSRPGHGLGGALCRRHSD